MREVVKSPELTPSLINFLIIKITGGVGSDGGPNLLVLLCLRH